ncbi:LPS export ABC transporter periplasmic protein LptC [Desulfohalobium retbaense]|uniref:LPS export ABC transporter periplasmic protein LptC n=1 Tax=Desulfohalobium retbaense (strain ATCC 49708 / DSM 5692 / JCM 16813 / HR100) TaxID=485915 RepID=C8X391_DESRD|nr:LPS export ABC transporter periplasmic protein LptC [Desulfohalobium retbaense]ACV68888.1 protein of unknown function DUF1239 [Desulfohalobium retbaense DSM 5692]
MAAVGRLKAVAAAIILMGMAAGGWLGWTYWQNQPSETTGPSLPVDMAMRSVHLQGGEQGRQEWDLRAANATYDRDQGMVDLEQPVLTLPMQDGRAVVRASRGRYNQDNGQATMWPDVQAEYQNGTVRAQKAVFVRQEDRLDLEEDVVFDWPGLHVTGKSAQILLEAETVVVDGGVQAELHSRVQAPDEDGES